MLFSSPERWLTGPSDDVVDRRRLRWILSTRAAVDAISRFSS
jgi:hypothetical protein